jgi:carbon-monoxide dehydrogenase large subunit
VPLEQIDVRCGDTALIRYGVGTYASRMAAVGGTAVRLAARGVREKALAIAEQILEASVGDLELRDGRVVVIGSPERAVTLGEIARRVAPGRPLPEGIDTYGLEQTDYFHPETNTFAYGTQIAIVEVDAESGRVHPLRMVVVGDCGKVINPLLVEGQYQGGISMGIGGALFEEIVHGADGQPLNPNFMDYLLPVGSDAPEIVIDHIESPSIRNPDGFKGVGEGGAIGAPAALANAVADALAPFGVDVVETPITPERIHRLIAEASVVQEAGT